MGKETQFSRFKVAPVVEKKSALRHSALSRMIPRDDRSAAIELDLLKFPHHDGAPIKEKI